MSVVREREIERNTEKVRDREKVTQKFGKRKR